MHYCKKCNSYHEPNEQCKSQSSYDDGTVAGSIFDSQSTNQSDDSPSYDDTPSSNSSSDDSGSSSWGGGDSDGGGSGGDY